MKRLLCIVGGMNVGGAETFLMKIYRKLDRTKYQLDFAVAVEEAGAYDGEIKALGGRIYHITPKSKNPIKNFCDVKKIVKEEQYNYVLRTSQHSLSALELLAAWLGGAKVRIFRSSNSNTTSGSGKELFLHKLFGFMPKCFANVKMAPSTEAAEYMFGKGCVRRGEVRIIHNGIDLLIYRFDGSERIRIRQELGISDTTLLVGHIGRFTEQKNHGFLLEIFKSIREKNENSVLILVGKGELEETIRNQAVLLDIEKQVIFTGIRNDVPALLSAMDVFVFPSLYEGMPNTVIEAQATGLPCVIADTITREADITGLVKYVSLKEKAYVWSDEIQEFCKKARKDTKTVFFENGYDIQSVIDEFTATIFYKDKQRKC